MVKEPVKRLVFVLGASRHFQNYHGCWWKALSVCVRNPKQFDLVEVLWNPVVDDDGNVQEAVCSEEHFPGKWIEILNEKLCGDFLKQRDDNIEVYLEGGDRKGAIKCFTDIVLPFLRNGDQVDIISYSLGTVLVYETLHKILHENQGLEERIVRNFFTFGSMLSWKIVKDNLISVARSRERPKLVHNWVNVMDGFWSIFPFIPTGDFAHEEADPKSLFDWRRRFGAYYSGVSVPDHTEKFTQFSKSQDKCEFYPENSVPLLFKELAYRHFFYFYKENKHVQSIVAQHLNS